MIKIRLARGGRKNSPFYRIIAIDSKRKRGGKPLEILGYWNPTKDVVKVSKEKLKKWQATGAKTTKSVDQLIERSK